MWCYNPEAWEVNGKSSGIEIANGETIYKEVEDEGYKYLEFCRWIRSRKKKRGKCLNGVSKKGESCHVFKPE